MRNFLKHQNLKLSLSTILLVLITGCNNSTTPAEQNNTEGKVENLSNEMSVKETTKISSTNLIEVNENNKAYFGNVHIHTSWSFDAYINGSFTVPDDAYRWAQGEAIDDKMRKEKLQINKPLDFYAVSEHAEYLGVFAKMRNPENKISQSEIAAKINSKDKKIAFKTFENILKNLSNGEIEPGLMDPALPRSGWKHIIDVANKHNKPGKFTTFPAFEWTSAPNSLNLHRIVLFKDDKNLPEIAFSALDSTKPEELWKYMDKAREKGAHLLAIPHNANASNGTLFAQIDSEGKEFDVNYSKTRMRNEPLYEISQIKGTSETHPILSPNDEFAGFEQWEYIIALPVATTKFHGGYLRQAYLDGIKMDSQGKGNPFKYGIIGDSDSHNAAAGVQESNYRGKFGFENTPAKRVNGPIKIEKRNKQVREFSSGGLAGVWAQSNTREAIFDAMRRKETFGTTGPRIKIRMFAGWNYDKDIMESDDWISQAYAKGTTMGGELTLTTTDEPPTFILATQKGPDSANLDRLQIIKGWMEDGESHEKIYNVVVSDGRVIDKDWNTTPVGNTVNVNLETMTVSYTNSIGDSEFTTLWQDPDFDKTQHAFYYARVIEIPTPRWSTYDSLKMGVEPRKDLPVTIQERAWTSPIWYSPK